jgi:hypothetical protein
MSMAELFLNMFATRRADGIRPTTRDETRLSVLGCGSRSVALERTRLDW